MKSLLLISLLLISNIGHCFTNKSLNSNRRVLSCNPTHSATSGSIKSVDFGRSYGVCAGFTCNPGYNISGETCIPAAVFNVVCSSASGYRNCTTADNLGRNVTTYFSCSGTNCSGGDNSTYDTKLNCPQSLLSSLLLTTSFTFNSMINNESIIVTASFTPSIPVYTFMCSFSNNDCDGQVSYGGFFFIMRAGLISRGCTAVP